MNGNEETENADQIETQSTKKARQVKHQAGFVDRVETKLHSRRTIPASPSNDEFVVDVVNVVKVFNSNSRVDGPTQRHERGVKVHTEIIVVGVQASNEKCDHTQTSLDELEPGGVGVPGCPGGMRCG